METNSEVILVHGLWFGSWAMGRLAKKLRAEGFRVRKFDYSTISGDLQSHAGDLLEFASESGADHLHFVSHSLGGLVTLKMLAASQRLPPGKVVLLGSPLDGSIVARKSGRVPGAEKLLGKVRLALEQGFSAIQLDRETGMIAGSRAFGLGVLLGGPGGPGDGTVAVRETLNSGLKNHLILPVTHTGMLYSREVARQSVYFLKNGHFDYASA